MELLKSPLFIIGLLLLAIALTAGVTYYVTQPRTMCEYDEFRSGGNTYYTQGLGGTVHVTEAC